MTSTPFDKERGHLLISVGFPAIVTSFYLEVRPVYQYMLASTFIYPKTEYRTVMNWVIEATLTADPSTEIVCVGATPPGEIESRIIVHIVTFSNAQSPAAAALAPLNETRPPHALHEIVNQPTSLDKEYTDQAHANPPGHRYCSDNAYISNDVDVAAVLESAFTELPNTKTFALWYAMNPCSRRSLPDMALSMHTDHYFALYTIWKDAKDDGEMKGWVKGIMKGVEKYSEGAYLGDSDFQVRKTKFWGKDQGKKLMDLRRRWDPHGCISGYLDEGDRSRQDGLANVHEWG